MPSKLYDLNIFSSSWMFCITCSVALAVKYNCNKIVKLVIKMKWSVLCCRGPSLNGQELESLAVHLSCLPPHFSLTPLLPLWLLDSGVNLSELSLQYSDVRASKLIDEAKSCSNILQVIHFFFRLIFRFISSVIIIFNLKMCL